MDGLLQLIDDVYSAAVGERSWDDLAPQIALTFGSTSTTLQVQRSDAASTILSMTANVRSRIDDYHAHFWQRDIWVDRAVVNVGLSEVGTSEDLVSDREFEETEFYRDWCRYLGVFYVVGSVFPTGDGELGVLGIHRPRAAGAYTAADKEAVARFLPHLQRALQLRARLGHAALVTRASFEVVERCQVAAIVVTGHGHVLHANAGAAQLLSEGSAIRVRNGRIGAGRDTESTQLLAMIRAVSGPVTIRTAAQDGAMLLHRPRGGAISVLVAPFRVAVSGLAAAAAIVFVRDPDKAISSRDILKTLFDLTPTESYIAESLANGCSIEQIAAGQHANAQTVRKQVKSIFAKTGTHRQAECVALILRSVATLNGHLDHANRPPNGGLKPML